MKRLLVLVLTLAAAVAARAQEYRIDRPGEPTSAPVYLTRPVEGRVEVQNLPAVQDVRVVGGPEEALEVRGAVEVRTTDPLPVEVVNLPEAPRRLEVEGTVRVDDERPVRVWVANPPLPTPVPEGRAALPFAAFAARGAFAARSLSSALRFWAKASVSCPGETPNSDLNNPSSSWKWR
ncbi:MAG: hypothetical protein IH608_07410, partial [Proteobacteria bacterium]|nr:hypothetical protein [Pseudomonadota bacterium]